MSNSNSFRRLILASQSPARLSLLREAGFEVLPFPTQCNEEHQLQDPEKVVALLACRKLDYFLKNDIPLLPKNWSNLEDTPIITCDTLIWFNHSLIGKAHDEEEAREMLLSFSGKTHYVYTGYALFFDGKTFSGTDKAEVTFKELKEAQIADYLLKGQWKGAAGSYRIQGDASSFIKCITGDISTVIGLPLLVISDILQKLCQSR